jgi:hypothetical protein
MVFIVDTVINLGYSNTYEFNNQGVKMMRHEQMILELLDKISMHVKSIEILRREDLTYSQALLHIAKMQEEFILSRWPDADCDEEFSDGLRSDEQDLIDDDNRDRANDMNAVSRSYY